MYSIFLYVFNVFMCIQCFYMYSIIISPRSKKWPEAFTIKTVNNVFIFYCQMIQDQEDAIRVIFKSPKFISLTVKSINNSLPRRL